jgi:tetratricopeptide (TPR) repeat protein
MGGNASVSNTTSTASFHANHPRQRIVQNFLIIWVDANIDESKQDCQYTVAQLRSVVNDVNIFTQPDECIQFLNGLQDEKVFVIASGALGQHLVPDIHDLPQVDGIHIFCGNPSRHEQWTKEWMKIKGIHTDIKPICQALQQAAKQYNQDSIAVSFVSMGEETSSQKLNQLEPSFICTQMFKEILLEMEHNEKSIKDLTIYCRKFYNDDTIELATIDEFKHNYRFHSPIWWYTRECFTYQMLNRTLRTLEVDTIIKMGFFIRDLHKQIQELHQEQVGNYHGEPFIVYRGQGLSKTDFEKLVETKGGLMSFTNFLSTSREPEVSFGFAEGALAKTNMVGVLFKITIDPSVSSTPFASIREVSYYRKEVEILFSMHTVFRVGKIKKIDNNKSLYQVDLKLTADDDQQLLTLSENIRAEVVDETGWQRLGRLLLKLSQFNKAEELYNLLLEQTSNEDEKTLYYDQLGYIKNNQGDYKKAIECYKKALKMKEKTLASNHPDLATSYSNIGLMSDKMGEYPKALSFYEKALEIRQKTLPPNHPDLATSYDNIGAVYRNMEEYSKALSLYEKAVEIRQKTLPPNHPSLATSYNDIGAVYRNVEEYSKALSFYEKALEIEEKTAPPNHPLLATSYNNIAAVHRNMGDYSEALSFYERALEIEEKTLPPNHPDLATLYNNIASGYYSAHDYSKALSYFERAQKIWQSLLPMKHPSIKTVQKNIETVKNRL